MVVRRAPPRISARPLLNLTEAVNPVQKRSDSARARISGGGSPVWSAESCEPGSHRITSSGTATERARTPRGNPFPSSANATFGLFCNIHVVMENETPMSSTADLGQAVPGGPIVLLHSAEKRRSDALGPATDADGGGWRPDPLARTLPPTARCGAVRESARRRRHGRCALRSCLGCRLGRRQHLLPNEAIGWSAADCAYHRLLLQRSNTTLA